MFQNTTATLQVKTDYVLWSVLVFFFYSHNSGFRRASVWAASWEKMSMLIAGFSDEMWMLQYPKEEIVAFFSKKKQFSKPSDKTSNTTGSSATMFLVDMIWTQAPANWHLKIPIKWYGSIYFVSLVGKKCSSICPEKATENSIQMVNALSFVNPLDESAIHHSRK